MSGIEPVTSLTVGGLAGTGHPIRASEPFVLAGVEWLAPSHAHIELRALDLDGRWTRWAKASSTGHGPDGEGPQPPLACGDPIWTGPALAVQLRSRGEVRGVTVNLVRTRRPAGQAAREAGLQASAARSFGGLPLAKPHLPAGHGQPPIIAREAWAGHHRHHGAVWYGDVRMGFVHHSDGVTYYSRAEVPQVILAIYDYHVHALGWSDIGYNFAIDRFGQIWEARAGGIDQAVVGAQAGGYNLESFGVVVLGTFSQILPTRAALRALEHFLAWKLPLHGMPVGGRVSVEVSPSGAKFTRFRKREHVRLPRIAGHRDGCETDCPGTALYDHLPVVRRSVKGLVGKRQLRLTIGFGGDVSPTPVTLPHRDRVKRGTFLRLDSVKIHAGDEVPVSGRLHTPSGDPVAGAPIQLQGLHRTREEILATVTTDRHGRWSATVSPKRSLLVRALHPVAPAVASPLVAIGVAPVVTLEVQEPAGDVIHGTVTPAKPHVMVTVRHARGHHHMVEHLHLAAHGGRFRHRLKLKPGHYHLQAHSIPDAEYVEASSPRVDLRVR